VYAQAEPLPHVANDLEKLHVRNKEGNMVPFSSFGIRPLDLRFAELQRFNGFPSITIQGESASGGARARRWKPWKVS